MDLGRAVYQIEYNWTNLSGASYFTQALIQKYFLFYQKDEQLIIICNSFRDTG